jgi:hypothetical protein
MLTETERAWLAGFLDADGMIRLRIGRKNKCKWKTVAPKSLVPIVLYTNTCRVTGERLTQLIGKAFIDFTATVVRSPRMVENNWRAKVTVEIGGMNRVEPFLKMLRPYLVTKAAEADLAIRFCEIRRERGRQSYRAIEYQIFEALKFLKQTRHLRDYTPSVEEILDEDIVRTNARALEVAEMTTRQTEEAGKEWARNLVSRYRWNREGHKSNS